MGRSRRSAEGRLRSRSATVRLSNRVMPGRARILTWNGTFSPSSGAPRDDRVLRSFAASETFELIAAAT